MELLVFGEAPPADVPLGVRLGRGWVRSVVFSPDGRQVVTGDDILRWTERNRAFAPNDYLDPAVGLPISR